ncbi:MAG: acetyl-CoA C-acetyltransferase [Verrucomicrobiia bacterium]|jgi:acetyl-CoA acyltransferase
MRDVILASYLRTAQSRSRPNDPARDVFCKMRSDDLLAALLKPTLEHVGVKPNEVDDLIVGCAQGVSEQWTQGGRTPLLLANLDQKTAAKFIDQQCGSTIAAAHIAFMEIATGAADIVLCGGMEHMTRVPMGGDGAIDLNLRFFSDPPLAHWDMMTAGNMGLTAEKLADVGGLTREQMDAWGVRSHQLAHQAQTDGFFKGEILPIEAKQADGSTLLVETDQSIRANAKMEDMAQLRTPFRENGKITVGTSSPLNAGACALLFMAKETAEAKGVKAMAKVRSIGFAGVEPNLMGKGPVPATRKALKAAGLEASDIDLWEINEAFAAVPLYAIDELGIDPEKVNVKGGGIAIGHPLGASGGRILGTLARIMEERDAHLGCATMCCGGGQGVSIIIEREASSSED